MPFKISFSKNAFKFIKINEISIKEFFELIKICVEKFKGENVNIDIKKLKGEWHGFYRIRKGKLRIILEFDFDNSSVLVEEIDYRGNIYKK